MADAKGTVVVTGAGSGIGFATARRLLDDGYDVAAWDVVAGALEGVAHPRLAFTPLDVRDKEAMTRAAAALPRIDGLVACAAVFKAMPFLEIDDETWGSTLAINLKGGLFACQAVLPAMRKAGRGSIVMFSSGIARGGTVNGAHYAATKGGVLGFARALALEVAREGVRVNVVSPGVTDTAQPRGNMTEAELYSRAADIPLGRIGQPPDIVEAVLFLLGDDSAFVTGQDIRVNGGARLI